MTTLPISLPALLPALIAALIGWRLYRRVRRLIGRQPVRKTRLVLTTIFFPLLVALLALTGLRDPLLPAGLTAGVVIGIGLAWYGLRTTVFEATEAGLFYTPNRALGIGLSVLFVGRIVYRFGAIYLMTGGLDPNTMQSFGKSPLTLLIFGVLAGYYSAYALGVLRWAGNAQRLAPPVVDEVDRPV